MKKSMIVLMLVWSATTVVWGAFPIDSPPNPVLPGADPHALLVEDVLWVYPTHYADPVTKFYAYSSQDMRTWEQHGPVLDFNDIAWIKDDGMDNHQAWAPAVIERGGTFYFYYSVGPQDETPSRIGVASGDTPAGPFVDKGSPLIVGDDEFEAIDPMVFWDEASETAYLYAGGSAGATLRVYALTPNMLGVAEEVPVETPPHFTEGAFMHERNDVYYLSYSSGSWWDASYKAHYATASSPVGPWEYGGVFLQSDTDHKGPGHHAFFRHPDRDRWFVVYHRWNHQRGLGPFNATRQVAIDRLEYDSDGAIEPVTMTGGNTDIDTAPTVFPPGVVINHSPQATGLYIGSPSITILPNGDYLAAHDFFGPESNEHECATAVVYRSSDDGWRWEEVTRLQCLFWPKLFTHHDNVYIMGVEKHHGRIVIRRSTDNGETWTTPRNATTGLLTPEGEYHTAPMPILEHDGRLWRAFEDASGGERWGERYMAGMLSIPEDADLLRAANWTFSNFIQRDPDWLPGDFRGWLEGNALLDRDGTVVNMLRVDTPGYPEKAAIVTISDDGKTASFDPETGFVDFPGGAKKFTIRYDEESDLYWSLATIVPPHHQNEERPARVRNTLALVCSEDLRNWQTTSTLFYRPEVETHGFQYVDWLFEEDDIIAVCRTAHDDGIGGARNNHDANFMTFHRIRNFRDYAPVEAP